MAGGTVNYKITADTTQAQRSLKQLQDRVGDVSSTFDKLKGAIAGIAFGAAIMNAVRYADAIQDIADVTGIAVQNILGFSQAVTLNGGDATKANDAILKLTQSIGAAAEGSAEAQSYFQKVGVSLKDLRTLSEQDLLSKTIKGIAALGTASERTTASQKLLGKGFAGVNIQGVAGDLDAAIRASRELAAATQAAAAVQGKLDASFQKLQNSILKAIQPIADFVAKLDQTAIDKFIDSAVKLATVLGGLFVIGKIIPLFSNLILAFTTLRGGTATLGTALGGLGKPVEMFREGLSILSRTGGALTTQFKAIGAAGEITGATINGFAKRIGFAVGGLARMLPLIGQAIALFTLLDAAVAALTGKDLAGWFDSAAAGLEKFVTDKLPGVAAALNALGEKLGMAPPPSVAKENEAELQRLKNRAAAQEELNKRLAAEADERRKVRTELEAFQQAQANVLAGLEDANRDTLASISFQKSLIGLSEAQVAIESAKEAALLRQIPVIRQLQAERDKLKLELKDDPTNETVRLKIAAIGETMVKVARETGDMQGIVARYTAELYKAKGIEESRQETLKRAVEDYAQLGTQLDFLTQHYVDYQRALEDISTASANMMVGPTQAALNDSTKNIQRQIEDAKTAYRELFSKSDGQIMSQEETDQLAKGLDDIEKRFKAVGEAQRGNILLAREWSTGLAGSMATFVDEAGNAAKQAQTYFETFTNGVENAFVKFVQTGKLSFKDLANSLIADFARIQAKKALAGLFDMGGAGGAGGIFGSIGKIFGFANGGNPAIGKPIMVGERGPELMIPRNASTIIPNESLGGGGGQTYVTYNINATDALSFKQQLARDPSFLHAVVEQGRRSTPAGARR